MGEFLENQVDKNERAKFIEKCDALNRRYMAVYLRALQKDNCHLIDADVQKQRALLTQEYPDANKYIIWHKLIGSSGLEKYPDTIYKDFPGDNSIEKFMQRLEETYK